MSEMDAVLYEYVKFIHVVYGSFSVSGFNRFMHFLSTYANSWIKIAARRTLFDPVWFPVGIRRWVGPGMALTTIGEVSQWSGVADWSSCRTLNLIWKLHNPRLYSTVDTNRAKMKKSWSDWMGVAVRPHPHSAFIHSIYISVEITIKNSFWSMTDLIF